MAEISIAEALRSLLDAHKPCTAFGRAGAAALPGSPDAHAAFIRPCRSRRTAL